MKITKFTLLCICLFYSFLCQAGVLAAKTRIVFKDGEHEQSLMLANTNDYPIILQTWVDQGEGDPDINNMPFLILPPFVKLASNDIHGLRILYNGKALPNDRETVFWLNLYEIPMIKRHSDQAAYMNLAMNTQLKLFYRPKQIAKMLPEMIVEKIHFKIVEQDKKNYIECENPTPYHASLINLKIESLSQKIYIQSEMDMMCYPYSTKRYGIAGELNKNDNLYTLSFDFLDDDGNAIHFQRNLNPFS
ncbi:molecular chaperone [Acinetobacter guillouiae]|uniref:fimbrial biogenesis chaperone n=1 Tax=Acinetobacter guillouiae TaxID=106649 RepID=UPI003AF70606